MSGIETQLLAGRYRLLNPLAEGGTGTVWLAADETLGRDVAIKEIRLPPDLTPDRRREVCSAALREANLAAGLKHPSIVTVHDVLIERERPWIVMELLSGASLEETVRRRRPLPVHQAARAGVGILSALVAVHAAGVVHRDVKPGNVFLTRTGRAVLIGFGTAVVEDEMTAGRTEHLIGSPNYIAPERLRGERGGPASDLWSLGATLYFAVEGLPPHPAETAIAAIGRVLTEPPRPPARAGRLGELLTPMLAPRPEDRPSAEEIAEPLREIALGLLATPPLSEPRPETGPPGRPERPGPPPSQASGPLPGAAPPPGFTPAPPPRSAPGFTPGFTPGRGRAALWAATEVAALAGIIAATAGVVHLSSNRSAPAKPPALSERPGAFATPVDLCGLLSSTDARRLLPALKSRGRPTNSGGCEWITSGMGLAVSPSGTDKQWGRSPRQAHELFVNQRNGTLPNGGIAWAWPDIQAGLRSARSTGPLEIRAAGDEAFGYDVYENRRTGRLEQSYVILRVDNLVLDVAYTVVDGSKDGPAIQAGAHNAATWVVDALNKRRAKG